MADANFEGDYLVRAVANGGQILALVARSTELVREARRLHGTSPTATAALGRVLTAAALMGATLKDGQTLTLRVVGDGPAGWIVATVRDMRIKGYIREPHIYLPLNAAGKLDVAQAIGKGMLYVTKDLGLREPYNGCVPLVSGEIGKDLAYYFTVSEQTPAAVGLGVLLDPDGEVRAAGGYILQLLPGASEEVVAQLEANVEATGPVSHLFAEGCTPEGVLALLLRGFTPTILARQTFAFVCDCSRERLTKVLLALGREELEALLTEQGEVEAKCGFCNRVYRFSREELQELIELAEPKEKN
ncbi:Hsp33 protein [Ammonifex degensii KC4]|uniref:33 kDa chaperonin n=1 Tax=Ammonifex degensii (strain DSM 10501 / KC4) TaxID=429009 RepID=C9RCV9_AMMDK|nr:Hsp33 family molecular chaperone HslO [Ammonifex degensii]ACX52086.1 Hsp33 protein [Ammonifex degensii KC4]